MEEQVIALPLTLDFGFLTDFVPRPLTTSDVIEIESDSLTPFQTVACSLIYQ